MNLSSAKGFIDVISKKRMVFNKEKTECASNSDVVKLAHVSLGYCD